MSGCVDREFNSVMSILVPGDFHMQFCPPVAQAIFDEMQQTIDHILSGLFVAHQVQLEFCGITSPEAVVNTYLHDFVTSFYDEIEDPGNRHEWQDIQHRITHITDRARPYLLRLADMIIRLIGHAQLPIEQASIRVYHRRFILDLFLTNQRGQHSQALRSIGIALAHRDSLPVGRT